MHLCTLCELPAAQRTWSALGQSCSVLLCALAAPELYVDACPESAQKARGGAMAGGACHFLLGAGHRGSPRKGGHYVGCPRGKLLLPSFLLAFQCPRGGSTSPGSRSNKMVPLTWQILLSKIQLLLWKDISHAFVHSLLCYPGQTPRPPGVKECSRLTLIRINVGILGRQTNMLSSSTPTAYMVVV